MAMIVHSPHDGQPVKVRDQDLERAIRDSEGRIFYAVKRSDGQGYYGALTRKGSEKDEQRYLTMLEKMQTAREVGKARSTAQVHDATGKRSGPGVLRWVLLLIVAVVIAYVAWQLSRPDNTGGAPIPGEVEPGGGSDLPGSSGGGTGGEEDRASGYGHKFAGKGYVSTPSGLRYKIIQPGTGATATAGRYVLIHYAGTKLSGEVFDQSDPDRPVGFVLWSGAAPRGWEEGITGMREGETRSLVLTPELLSGPYPGAVVLPDRLLQFDITLEKILPGISYTVLRPGEGSIAGPGDRVEVHYKAYVEGQATAYDDTRLRGEPVELPVGYGQLIPGWEYGVIGMKEGELRRIDIPSYLAYGERGAAGVIPPWADLRYTVELLRVHRYSARQARADR